MPWGIPAKRMPGRGQNVNFEKEPGRDTRLLIFLDCFGKVVFPIGIGFVRGHTEGRPVFLPE